MYDRVCKSMLPSLIMLNICQEFVGRRGWSELKWERGKQKRGGRRIKFVKKRGVLSSYYFVCFYVFCGASVNSGCFLEAYFGSNLLFPF